LGSGNITHSFAVTPVLLSPSENAFAELSGGDDGGGGGSGGCGAVTVVTMPVSLTPPYVILMIRDVWYV
jgi:hypothetical protein